jgi:hypothetical protein
MYVPTTEEPARGTGGKASFLHPPGMSHRAQAAPEAAPPNTSQPGAAAGAGSE